MGLWIVTGGSGGIGRKIAGDAVARGHRVLVWDIRPPADGEGPDFDAVDLTDPAAIAAACARVAGPVETFVHCAGVLAGTSAVHGNLAQAMEFSFRLHCLAFVLSVQGLLDRFPAQGGSAIAIASAAIDMVYPGTLAYGPSKAALRRAIEQLAVELGGRGIRVNCVSPGAVSTEMTRHLWEDPEFARERIKHIPLGRQGATSHVSDAVAFLASGEARYITGEDLWVDGGVRHGIFQKGVREFMEQANKA